MVLSLCLAVGTTMAWPTVAQAQQQRAIDHLSDYHHARFAPICNHNILTGDFLHEDTGYVSCFDGPDDDDGDGVEDDLGIPHWVAQEIHKHQMASESGKRPSKWFLPPELKKAHFAPTDDSYRYEVRPEANWYDRGHLAQKYLVERLGQDAAWNTHDLVNAVPQRHDFNAGIWLDLECRTGAWANHFGAVWVIAGPLFLTGRARVAGWIGEQNEMPVAIPDALFKIVVREEDGVLQTLAFIYPQQDPTYEQRKTWNHEQWLVSVNRIEDLTGLSFPALSNTKPPNDQRAQALWPYYENDIDRGCLKSSKWGAQQP